MRIQPLTEFFKTSDRRIFFAVLSFFILFAWYCHSANWDLVQAHTGFSPITYVMQWAHPENFVRDFPSGLSIMDGSSFMHIYKYAYSLWGIHPEITGYAVVLTEIILVVIAFIALARVISPDVPKTALFLLVLVVVGSGGRNVNLAYFGFPFFEGHYYNTADFLRIMAFVALMTQRYIWAGLLIGLCFTVHPIYALTGGVFMAAYMLVQPTELKAVKLWLGGGIAALIAGAWVFFTLDFSQADGPKIPLADWFTFTYLNSHWYPRYLGVLTGGAPQKLLPFMALMIVFMHYLKQRAPFNRLDRGVLAGMVAAAFVTFIGLVFAEQRDYPFLIKICLVRACDIAVIVALPYVVMGLLKDITKGDWRVAIPAFGLLISPFMLSAYPGWHGLFMLALVVPLVLQDIKRREMIWFNGLIIGAILVFLGYCAYYMSLVDTSKWVYALYYDDTFLNLYFWLVVLAFGIRLFAIKKSPRKLEVAGLCLIISLLWLWEDRDYSSSKNQPYAQSYKDVQLWAKTNTPNDALFMVEPTINYGWRAYSQRSSFGAIREQYLLSWMYNSDYDAFSEGQRRLRVYETDLIDLAWNDPVPVRSIPAYASKEFNNIGEADLHNKIVTEFGVDYFVFDKIKLFGGHHEKDIQRWLSEDWETAYENDKFIVLVKQ